MPVTFLLLVLVIAASVWLIAAENHSVLAARESSAQHDPEIRKAAEAGDAGAQYRLGEALLQDPNHSAETSATALHWLQLSAENGNTEAMIVLGRLSRSGVGLLQNFSDASKWIRTAADRGDPEGMLELGRLYRDGIGVEKSPVLAYVWFNRASAARNLDAVREREAVARTLTPEELAEAQHRSVLRGSESENVKRSASEMSDQLALKAPTPSLTPTDSKAPKKE